MAWQHTGSRHERGYNSRWTKLRTSILARDLYLCQHCLTKGRPTQATEVHHVKAKADGGTDDPENLVSICHDCHVNVTVDGKGHRRKKQIGIDGWPVDG